MSRRSTEMSAPACPLPEPGSPKWDWGTNARGEFEARGIVGTGIRVYIETDDWGRTEYLILRKGQCRRSGPYRGEQNLRYIENEAIKEWRSRQPRRSA